MSDSMTFKADHVPGIDPFNLAPIEVHDLPYLKWHQNKNHKRRQKCYF